MSKLVEGIKDRVVAAAREAAPAVVDAAQKAATAAAEKVAEAVADAKNVAGETSVVSEPATAAEPVAAAQAPEGAIFNPEAARGNLHLGIDVGSTTVKLAVLNDDNQIVYAKYQRHHTDVRACARDLFEGAATVLPTAQMTCAITGSGGLLLSQWLDLEFVQEVIASKRAVETLIPATDVAIELGGEDAKIIYFDNGIEQRMNGTCAGGTGAFIDQMATLLHTDASGLNELAANATTIYPIASRCGVFAKTDVQPLLNEGARPEDVAASIFQAVVTQTISGLACGRPIRGNVAFLGGPLQYLSELRHRFYLTLNLDEEHRIVPQNAHLFVASGAAMAHESNKLSTFPQLIEAIDALGDTQGAEVERLDPLFATDEDFAEFKTRHDQEVVPKGKLEGYTGRVFIGIDAGSTTMKAALVGEDGQLLHTWYGNNNGDILGTAKVIMADFYNHIPAGCTIGHVTTTGYGEALLIEALKADSGEIETVAHLRGAKAFLPGVEFILDIGGQDMKCLRVKDGVIEHIMLNEACSSGCGSFIESFAVSMNMDVRAFADAAIHAKAPVDLGSRCTVFMNSKVKQAQKEGASVADISAGLAYSVIKNALFKVIKVSDASELGKNIVVQGGTFYNEAVLRAFEKEMGVEVIRPDIAGLMGAYGAALYGLRQSHKNNQTTSAMMDEQELEKFAQQVVSVKCGGCGNHCQLTVNTFADGRKFISGNRCEKRVKNPNAAQPGANLMAYKRQRLFDYPALAENEAKRGVIGIPRVLNLYENYPYWAPFFRQLGFRVVVSPFSTRAIYEMGMESIPSESECYPAKLAHGHVEWLVQQGIATISHPCVFYEYQETKDAQNHYNCPMVVSYPENLKNNVEAITTGQVRYIRPFIAFTSEKIAADRLAALCKEEWGIDGKEVRAAVHSAWEEQQRAKADVRAEGQKALQWMAENHARGIVLAGRPYHIDPEINHGIPEMIASYDLAVLTEDSLPIDFTPERPLRVNDQWVYHSRLYSAAEFVRNREDLELIQLNSFGCGLDAVTTDQVCEILEGSNKLYTVLKIDEVNNLGAARIRIRSLLAAMNQRQTRGIRPQPKPAAYHRSEFTKEMYQSGDTIRAPQMSPIHFDLLEPSFKKYGYHIEVLANDNRAAIDMGLKFVNNDACFPSITVVGQIMDAVLSGKYDTDKLAVMMTQTGGCCRASNYVGFIRRALEKAGYGHIPVVSVNLNGMEKNEGFTLSKGLIMDAVHALVYGDLFMRCLYHVRPYELEKGSAEAIHQKWKEICVDSLVNPKTKWRYADVCRGIVADFDALPIAETLRKPRVGIVGEILVKYMPLANNHLVELLEAEGAEAVVPDLLDFFNYSIYGRDFRHKNLGTSWKDSVVAKAGVEMLRRLRAPALEALEESRRFEAPMPIEDVAKLAEPFLAIGNQYGEGWFLAGEMAELITSGTPNIVCIQPFACLPNHVVGKGVIKALRAAYPGANIVAVDYDPGASEVNQLNRIKLMLTAAQRALHAQEATPKKPQPPEAPSISLPHPKVAML